MACRLHCNTCVNSLVSLLCNGVSELQSQTQQDAHTLIYVVLRGLSIGVMVFILYKLYILSTYTTPSPKPITENILHFLNFKKTLFSMFFNPFGLRGHRKCPHKPCLRCNTHVIIHICVPINHVYKNTHTHTLGFHVLWGHSIDIRIFIVYKLYILSPNPNTTHHKKTLFYKLFSSKCHHKDNDFGYCHLCGDILSL